MLAESCRSFLQLGLRGLLLGLGGLQRLLLLLQRGLLSAHLLQHLAVLLADLLQCAGIGQQVVQATGAGDHGNRAPVVHHLHGPHAGL